MLPGFLLGMKSAWGWGPCPQVLSSSEVALAVNFAMLGWWCNGDGLPISIAPIIRIFDPAKQDVDESGTA